MLKHRYSTVSFHAIILAVLLLVAFSLVPHAPSAAAAPLLQSNGVQMSAEAAFDGYYKYGEWLPVWVELSNQGSDIAGEVRVQVTGSQGTLVFSVPVELPSGSRKRIPVYVLPNNFSRELDVQFLSNDQLVTSQKTTVRPQANIAYFVGFISDERGALALLNGIKLPGQERPKILVDVTLDELPERAEGLRAFDLLVFNDVDTTRLTPQQKTALAGWVQKGGQLVIGGGAGAQRTIAGIPESLLPARIVSSAEIDADALQPLSRFAQAEPIMSSGSLVAALAEPVNSRVIAGSAQMPMLFERTVSDGRVFFSALDLTGVPFNGWPGTQAFWETIIGSSGVFPQNMPYDASIRQWQANMLSYPLSNIPSLDLPSIQSVSILLLVYIFIVGPANYLLLRRQKRLHWAWITIPVITILFTGAAFGIGYGMRGTDLILNKIALVETGGSGDASVTSYMGLFSPRMQSYEITVEGESLISPMSGYDPGGWGGGGVTTGGEMVFEQGQPSKVQGLTVNQWAMQSFMAEGSWENFGGFTGDLRIENDALVGTIRNDSAYTITDVVVVMLSRFQRFGDMAPGEEKEVDLALANLQSDRFGPPISYRLFQENFTTGPMPRDLEQKSNILNSVFENGMWSKLSSVMPAPGLSSGDLGGVTVLGWLDQAPPQVNVSENSLTQRTTALVYTSMNYNLPEQGFITLPPGLLPGTISQMPREGGICGPSTSVHMARGEAQFEFTVPGDLDEITVDKLKVALWRDSGPGAMPSIALYDWEEESWIQLQSPIQGVNVVEKAGPYVSYSGIVRVSMSSESDTFGCVYIDLGMEATGPAGQGG